MLKQISLFFLILCMLYAFCGCGTSDVQETRIKNTNSGINTEIEETGNNSSNNKTGGEKSDSFESENAGNNDAGAKADSENKVLIAYFSRADENYGVGYVEKGNTAIIAEIIAEETGGELFHIERETPYPAVYDKCRCLFTHF